MFDMQEWKQQTTACAAYSTCILGRCFYPPPSTWGRFSATGSKKLVQPHIFHKAVSNESQSLFQVHRDSWEMAHILGGDLKEKNNNIDNIHSGSRESYS